MAYPDLEKYDRSTMDSWNFRRWHVEMDRGGQNTGTFITSESVLIAAGPARLSDMSDPSTSIGTDVIPIGLTDNISIAQNKMLEQIFEIGARRAYAVSGRVTGNITISRVLFNGPSLLRVLTGASQDQEALDNDAGLPVFTGLPAPNEASFASNLQSELFDRPLGLMVYMIDQRNMPFGALYAEDSMVQTHAFNIAAQGMTIREQVSLTYTLLNPVAVSGIGTSVLFQ